MIIHTLKMCCILNPFFTKRQQGKEVSSQRAVPPVQLSHHPLKPTSVFVCLFHDCKLTFTCLQNTCSERRVDYKPKLLWPGENGNSPSKNAGATHLGSPHGALLSLWRLLPTEGQRTGPTPAGDSGDSCPLQQQEHCSSAIQPPRVCSEDLAGITTEQSVPVQKSSSFQVTAEFPQ